MAKNSFVAEVTFKLYLDIGDVIHIKTYKHIKQATLASGPL